MNKHVLWINKTIFNKKCHLIFGPCETILATFPVKLPFNSRCLHVITGEEYRVTAVSPAYNLQCCCLYDNNVSVTWDTCYVSHYPHGPQNPHSHGGWRQPLPRREPLHGLPGFRTERPWDPGSKPHGMAEQSCNTCGLNYAVGYHWTIWVHHENDDFVTKAFFW